MKKLLFNLFNRWWVLPIISIVLFVLFFEFDNLWFLLLSFLSMLVSMISLFAGNRKKLGWLSIFIMLVYLGLATFWLYIMVFPTPYGVHRRYAKQYENRSEIENIIGVEIPRFKVVKSELVHLSEFDFEFEVRSEIEFKKTLDDNFFHELDSICALPVPKQPSESSSYFYYGLEQIGRCWSKKGKRYEYYRNTDFGKKFLHSTDAYFGFTITKGSRTARIEYGNY